MAVLLYSYIVIWLYFGNQFEFYLLRIAFLMHIINIVLYTSIIWLFATALKLMYKDNTAYLKIIWGNAMTNAGIKFPTVTQREGANY